MKRMSKGPVLAAILGATLFVPLAAMSAELKVGVINVQRLLAEAPQAKVVAQGWKDEFGPRQAEIEKLQKDLRGRAEKLQRDGDTMTDGDRRAQEKALRDGQFDLDRKQKEFEADFNLRRNEDLSKLQGTLRQEVQAYARTANLDLVVSSEAALYANESLDVTSQVLASLQRAKPAAATPAPAKPAAPAPAKPGATTPPKP
jgi:outer membrane protein